MKNFISFALLIIFTFSILVNAQTKLIPEKYLKIKPVISTRDDVENVFGKRDISKNSVLYKTNYGVMGVDYSYRDCKSGVMVWGMPKGTVEEVFYVPSELKPLKLKDVILDFSRFEGRYIGDIVGQIEYYNEEFGISIVYLKVEKTVSSITIKPTTKQKKQFACDAK